MIFRVAFFDLQVGVFYHNYFYNNDFEIHRQVKTIKADVPVLL